MAPSPTEILVRQAPAPSLPPRPSPDEVFPSDANIILAITASLFGLSFLVVVLRCYIRAVMLKSFGVDDVAMLCALVMATMCMVCIGGMVQNGAGRYLSNQIPNEWQEGLNYWAYIIGVFIVTGVGFVKISIGLFLRRFTRNQIWHTRIIDGLTVFSTIFLIYSIFTFVFACIPLRGMWAHPNIRNQEGVTCMSGATLGLLGNVNGAINITTDILYVLLPIPVVWALKTNTRTKVMLVAIFGLGLFACGASIARMIYAYERSAPNYTRRFNFIVWFFIELQVGILAASLPSLKPLFKSFFKAVSGITGQSYGASRSNNSAARNPRSGYIKHSENNSSIPLGSVHTGRMHSDYHAGASPNPNHMSFMRDDGSEDGLFPHKGIEKKTEIMIRQEELRHHEK